MFCKYNKPAQKKIHLINSGLIYLCLLPTALNAMEYKFDNNEKHSGAVTVKHCEPMDLQTIQTRLNLMSSIISNGDSNVWKAYV